jgi:hypothetical protein
MINNLYAEQEAEGPALCQRCDHSRTTAFKLHQNTTPGKAFQGPACNGTTSLYTVPLCDHRVSGEVSLT